MSAEMETLSNFLFSVINNVTEDLPERSDIKGGA